MSTKYPAQIDTTQSLPTSFDTLTPVRGVTVNTLRDAILAIEATLGTQPNGVYSNVANRLTTLENLVGSLQIIELDQDLGGTLEFPLVIGLQGNPVSNVIPQEGQVLTWNGIAWVPLSNGEVTVTLNGPAHFVEIGQVIVNPIFSATYSSPPITAYMVDSVGNAPENVFAAPPPSVPPNTFVYPHNYVYNSYPATPFSVTWTLTANDGLLGGTATTTTTWAQKLYYGIGTPGGSTGTFIRSLQNSLINTSRNTTFTVNAGNYTANQAIYFAYRTAYGPATFWAGGFEGGFQLISTSIPVTNSYGFTENYTLYQSDQVGLGVTTISVF